jgi:hypothetical protein
LRRDDWDLVSGIFYIRQQGSTGIHEYYLQVVDSIENIACERHFAGKPIFRCREITIFIWPIFLDLVFMAGGMAGATW